MSYKVVRKVLERSSQHGSARLVLVIIAEHANHQGFAFPGIRKISREAKLHERTTQKLIRKLERSGELQTAKSKGRYGTNSYQVMLRQIDCKVGVAPGAYRGGVPVQRGVVTMPPKPSEETLKESSWYPSKGSDRNLEHFDPSEILYQMRQRLGKKMAMPGTKIVSG